MSFRKLRIVFSVAFGMICILLIALWVRSYSRMDQIYGHTSPTKVLHFGSMCGQLTFRYITDYRGTGIVRNWRPEGESVSEILKRRQRWPAKDDLLVYRFESPFGFGWESYGFYLPHWTLALAAGAGCIALSVPWTCRFSLRALLIATTAVAAALGVIAWARRL
jgi:hypothetical protein